MAVAPPGFVYNGKGLQVTGYSHFLMSKPYGRRQEFAGTEEEEGYLLK